MTASTSNPGQEESGLVRLKHPGWCDLSRCTVPAFEPPQGASHDAWGVHRSADLSAPVQMPVGEVFLRRSADAGSTFLCMDGVMLTLSEYEPLIWALVDEHAYLKSKHSALRLKQIRAKVSARLATAKEARS
ncbi:MAG TPA: hypothetical protein VGS97_26030 [Actinocrinis sp.]|uniref:hypothetical protein n=1 Tax=Actinocrinis sp. TaxID=1920516 RepID=UPI002DDCF7CB|nr:hypothetical protein [Actinocrinis sp.]HEV2347577.1 hypothetical protein [Actinocrinis sp.]